MKHTIGNSILDLLTGITYAQVLCESVMHANYIAEGSHILIVPWYLLLTHRSMISLATPHGHTAPCEYSLKTELFIPSLRKTTRNKAIIDNRRRLYTKGFPTITTYVW